MTKVWMEGIVVLGLTSYILIRYSIAASVVNLCMGLIPIGISITISYYVSRYIDIDHLVFIRLVLKGIMFFGVYFGCMFMFSVFLKTLTPEWRYIWQTNEKIRLF
jgi:hypothetical protein